MSEWRECRLGDIVSHKKGFAFKSSSYSDIGEVYIVRVSDTTSSSININTCMRIRNCEAISLSEYKIVLNDIIIATVGSWADNPNSVVGKVIRVPVSADGALLNQNAVRLRSNELANQIFLFYNLRNNSFSDYLLNSAQGSANQASITLQDIFAYSFLLPPLPEQRAIASVLSSLDDKIDLLHRQNKTIEALAETLFRKMFIEDAPQPSPRPSPSGRGSEEEEADEGWEEGTVADLCQIITKGTTPTTLGHCFTDAGVNFVKAESITDTGDFIWEKFAKISIDTHEFLNRSMLQEGDILCSIAGTIGRLAITTREILPANTNQAIAIIRVNQEKCFPEFIYLFLKSPSFKDIMDGKIVHAVQPNLSLGEIGNTPICIPQKDIMDNFRKIVVPLFIRKRSNTIQIRTLSKLRDTLLPKLMSGEVRVECS